MIVFLHEFDYKHVNDMLYFIIHVWISTYVCELENDIPSVKAIVKKK